MARKKSAIQLTLIGLKIPTSIKKFVREQIIGNNPSYLNESDFYRAAILEKVKRDYPDFNEIEKVN